ncbi:MAG: nicotinamide-nucleotide amidohydrolase family protein [Anaerolineae bacterium]|nr:nicotinamide-nucleotide amidohydrolase family protein [Anaerolineae bacterium]MDW7992468.1 nicotinamide-nucleotide amidohydrolase family protein [Anaerolineae bacterium]
MRPVFTVHKLDHEGREVFSYPATPIFRTPDAVLLKAIWDRPPIDAGYVVLELGDGWLETFYADRWYNVFEIRSADGRLKGRYCNITRPARIFTDAVYAEDLALDVWIAPDGQTMVLDEEEFARISLPPRERTAVEIALETILKDPLNFWQEPPLEVVVGHLLRERGLTLATAESCTGGLLGHRVTEIPGSSDYYLGSVVAYANAVKVDLLGVPPEVLEAHGAVSRETALWMARGARRLLGADLALSVTGIAGPGGGTLQKPVGLTFIALAAPDGEWVEEYHWRGDRSANKDASAAAALALLRWYLAFR